jgi:3-isopropylmalate/(R)-2-methylmalate dehydratase small subunit
MRPFVKLDGVAVALPLDNVDTDQLLPARFLKVPRSQGYGALLLHDLRFGADGRPHAGFPLNDPARTGPQILVARSAFGVGSSREAAVYALVDFGIRCVVATSFGDIFAGNAANNGLLAAVVGEEEIGGLIAAVERNGRARVDLEACTISAGGASLAFAIDAVRRIKLINGWGDLQLTMSYKEAIDSFAAADRLRRPWATVTARSERDAPLTDNRASAGRP